MAGLDPEKNYRFKEINRVDNGMGYLTGQVVSGRVLMEAGLKMNLGGEYASRVFELTAESFNALSGWPLLRTEHKK